MGAGATIGGIIILLIILGGLYYLYSIGTFTTLLSTPISSIINNPNSYVGKQITVTGDLGDGAVSGTNWYSLYSRVGYVEVHINNESPYAAYDYSTNYTMTGIFTKTEGCSLPYSAGINLGSCSNISSTFGSKTIEIYYLNVSSVKPA
jgi:hypothetical protein